MLLQIAHAVQMPFSIASVTSPYQSEIHRNSIIAIDSIDMLVPRAQAQAKPSSIFLVMTPTKN